MPWFLAGLLAASTVVPSSQDGLISAYEEETAFRLSVTRLLDEEAFDALEAMASKLRVERPRFSNGSPQLAEFHGALRQAPPTVIEAALEKWLKARPQSSTALILKATLHLRAAEEAGTEREALQNEELNKAQSLLVAAEATKTPDPVVYLDMLDVSIRMGKPPAEGEKIFERGLQVDGDFEPLYTLRLGELRMYSAADVERFVTGSADRMADNALYARLVLHVARWDGVHLERPTVFSWPRVRKGYERIVKDYPRSSELWSQYLWMACKHRDRDTASRLSARLKGHWSEDARNVWGHASYFAQCSAWAGGDDSALTAVTVSPTAVPPKREGPPLVVLKEERREFERRVSALFEAGKFEELEQMAAALRKDKPRFSNGMPQLWDFYRDLGSAPAALAEPAVQRWLAAWPKSLAARIVSARLLMAAAGRARGNGWADSVSEAGWRVFSKKTDEAWATLVEAERLDASDPALFETMLGICQSGGLPVERTIQVFAKGVAADREFDHLYIAMVENLLPRWGGSREAVRKFVEAAAAERGDALYARLAWIVQAYEFEDAKEYAFQWARVKKGFDELLAKYPRAAREWHGYLRMACEYKDKETAARLVHQLAGPWTEDAHDVWEQRPALFEQCAAWAVAP